MNISGLYAIAGSYRNDKPVERMVEAAIKGGASIIQLREKNTSAKQYIERATRVKAITDRYGVPLIIDDRADIALASGATGVHLGQNDLPIEFARQILGSSAVIGISVQTPQQAIMAQRQGADYIGAGPVFPTISKDDAEPPIGIADLYDICHAVTIPVIAIGGIYSYNATEVMGAGAAGIAVISAIFNARDIAAATAELIQAMRRNT
ncbi:thiamine phosphate synthase [Mahella australiensis]|uniref:Thiamine-phosphate synthase n=1 Tax=Mahella australiensis (strain DSM 15567 / CIP 107919 / 50-1 BON) TaxID=697281 RepID=F4A2F3_MAHA5|nr:thiamine phosphate synthase [Mahella australiensis]AEE97219.1 thiamine-phosphate diphosphorylase [Mahella australiensis 50-1 BON]